MTNTINNPKVNVRLEEFLVQLFIVLEQRKITYCILRNYQTLPESIDHDIDMLVSPSDIRAFDQCIRSVSKDTDWSLIIRPKRYGYMSYWYQSNTTEEVVHFDIWSKINWKGWRWMDEAAILNKRTKYRQFYIPALNDEVAILIMKDLIQDGSVKIKYKSLIEKAASQNHLAFIKTLQWGLGKKISSRLSTLIGMGQWQEIGVLKNVIRRSVLLNSIKRNPVLFVFEFMHFLLGYVNSLIFNPTGIFIVLVGPDGSGKSTIAEGLIDNMRKIFPSPYYYHGRFGFLPELRIIYNKVRLMFGFRLLPPAPSGSDAIHDIKTRSLVRALVHFFYYLFDYLLGYFVVGKIRVHSNMLIFDRYFYDSFILPGFSKLQKSIASAFLKLIPKPDFLFYLKCNANDIHQRKPELQVDQINNQQRMIEHYLSGLECYREIDTSLAPEQSVQAIVKIIIKFLRKNEKG